MIWTYRRCYLPSQNSAVRFQIRSTHIMAHLLTRSTEMLLHRGALKEIAMLFGTSIQVVSRIWKQRQNSHQQGRSVMDVVNKRRGNSGRKPLDRAQLKQNLRHIAIKKHRSLRAVGHALGISHQSDRNLVNERLSGSMQIPSNQSQVAQRHASVDVLFIVCENGRRSVCVRSDAWRYAS